jgi:hypothetical protein
VTDFAGHGFTVNRAFKLCSRQHLLYRAIILNLEKLFRPRKARKAQKSLKRYQGSPEFNEGL